MPRFFLHVRSGTDTVLLDTEGLMIGEMDLQAATLAAARERMSQQVLAGELRLNERIDVEDESGAIVHSLAFFDAIEVFVGATG